MLHYNPRHVSSINMAIFRTNCIITASGIVTLCMYSTIVQLVSSLSVCTVQLYNWYRHSLYVQYNCTTGIVTLCMYSMPAYCTAVQYNCTTGIVTLCMYSMPDESRQSLLSSGILYSRLQRVTIGDAVIIKFVLLKMGMLMLETCRGL